MSAERRVIAVGAPPTFRQQVARAMDTDPENVEWTPTVSVAESLLTEDGHAPNALVLSPTIKEVDAFGFSEFVGRMSPVSAVLLVRDRQANGVLPAAMRSGIRDVIDLSRGGEELRDALKRALEWSENLRAARDSKPVRTSEHRATVISVFSSKGGTGKTFLSCNMAWAIASVTQKDTALLDLEIDHADTFSYFGKEPNIPIQDLLALGEEEDREAILETGTKLGEHLWGYAPPPTMEDVSGEAMGKVIRAFRDNFHFVVVDGSSRYSDAALAAFDLSDTVFLMAGLDVVGVRHLSLALQNLLSVGLPRDRFRIVLNRADSKVGLTAEEVERVMKVKVDGQIPSSRLVPVSLNQGRTVVDVEPKSPVAKAVQDLARKVAGNGTSEEPRKRGLFSKN
jgi:pilus assembly protein CpaE